MSPSSKLCASRLPFLDELIIQNCGMSSKASSNLSSKRTYKIVLLGDSGVGKTALINRFVHNKFEERESPTVGIDFVGKNISHQNVSHRLQLWDTAGQERYRSLIPNYLKDAQCAIFIYDMTNAQSLQDLESWISLLMNSKADKSLLLLCGNKSDLVSKGTNPEIKKVEDQGEPGEEVPQKSVPNPQTIKFLMKKYKAQHFEVSASSGDNVNEMFNSIVESISEGQEKRKNKFKDLEIPVSSLDIYPAIMSSDRAGRQNTESQLTLDIQNQGKKAGRKKITQKEDFEEETFVAEAVPCWKRCCNFCGK